MPPMPIHALSSRTLGRMSLTIGRGSLGMKIQIEGDSDSILQELSESHESELLWAQLKFSFTNSLSFDSLSVRVGENEAFVPYY